MVVLEVHVGAGNVTNPTDGEFIVVEPNPVTIFPGIPTTVEVKRQLNGVISPLAANEFCVAVWTMNPTPGLSAMAHGHFVTLTVDTTVAAGTVSNLTIDVRAS